jgi:hypothetical protein
MPRILVRFLLASFILGEAFASHAQQRRKLVYLDRGACEGEACSYGRWKTLETTNVYARPDERSRIVRKFRVGQCVTALTGEVHIFKPGRFVVLKSQGRFKPGDIIYAYTYTGEEVYKIRHKGRWHAEQQLTYSPRPGPDAAKQCTADANCWGVFEEKPDSVWWIKMRDDRGRIGWTREPQRFLQPYWGSEAECKTGRVSN